MTSIMDEWLDEAVLAALMILVALMFGVADGPKAAESARTAPAKAAEVAR